MAYTKLTEQLPGNNDAMPRHKRISQDLCARISRHEWPVGGKLPGRHVLAREYGVDLHTLQHAVAELLDAGILYAVDRQGTFVAMVPPMPVEAVPPMPAVVRSPSGQMTVGILAESTESTVDTIFRPTEEWHLIISKAVEYAISATGGRTRYCNLYQPGQPLLRWADGARRLIDEGVDALVLIQLNGIAESTLNEIASLCDEQQIPLVDITWEPLTLPIAHLFYDQRDAGYQATRHLLKAGYRNLIFFAPFTAAPWSEKRLAGAQHALHTAHIAEATLRVYPEVSHYEAPTPPLQEQVGRVVMRQAMADGMVALGSGRPCGLVAPNDAAAYGMIAMAAEQGYVAGRDFGIISFDDWFNSRMIGLTSMRPPLDGMGTMAARMVLGALQGEEMALQVRMRSGLISRASTLLA